MAETIFEKPLDHDVNTLSTDVTNLSNSIGTVPSGNTVEGQISALNNNITNITMPDGTNLNNISATDRTKWYVGSDISKMTNIPTACVGHVWPFNLEVIPFANGTLYNRQILHCFGTIGAMNMYVRTQTYSGGSVVWNGWEEFALKSEMLWTRVGNGVTNVTLTSVPNSLIAYVYKSGTTNYIPILVDTDNNGYYRGGQYFGSNSGFAASILWNKSTMKLEIAQLYENGTDITSSAIMRVYIK